MKIQKSLLKLNFDSICNPNSVVLVLVFYELTLTLIALQSLLFFTGVLLRVIRLLVVRTLLCKHRTLTLSIILLFVCYLL